MSEPSVPEWDCAVACDRMTVSITRVWALALLALAACRSHLNVTSHKSVPCVAGNGVVIHLPGLFEEAEKNEKKGRPSMTLPHSLAAHCVPVLQSRQQGRSWAVQTL